jgi:hypothetical protein
VGVQTDVVIAGLDEAQAVARSDCPAADRAGFTFNGFDRVQLCTLLSLLRAGRPDVEFENYLDRIEVVSAFSGESPAVSVVPPEMVALVARVAGLDGTQFEALAATWAATEEFAGWSGSDVRELLRELGDLAESALLEGKCLLIWQSQ